MAKRIAEVEVVARLDKSRYYAELKGLTAATIAEMEALEREKVKINIDINRNEVQREISRLQDNLAKAQAATDNGAKGRAKQIEQALKRQKNELQKVTQAGREWALAQKIIALSEKEHADAVAFAEAKVKAHTRAILSDAAAIKQSNAEVEKRVGVLNKVKSALDSDRDAIKKFNAVWRVFTNSSDPMETLKKTLREPVKLGPFTATVRGLATTSALLGPILMSLGGSAVALGATLGTAIVSGAQLATAAIGGFGQVALGLSFALKPVGEEMAIAKQATDAYQKAVLKYGSGSKQASKAQEQMNNVLKGVSPLARQAATSLSEAKTSFMEMTGPTRQSAGKALTDIGQTARQLSGQFASNTNVAASGIQQGLGTFLNQLRSAEKGGGGPFNTMFSSAATATRPLVVALGNVTMYLARIGASASRHIGPLVSTFRKWSESLLNGSANAGTLNAKIDRMMLSLKSVGNLAMAAGRWLGALAGASDEAGRSLTDGLAGKFRQWTAALNSDSGRKSWSDWFKSAADLTKNFFNTLIPIIRAFGDWSQAMTPFTAGLLLVTSTMSKLIGVAMRLPLVSESVRILGAALASIYIGNKIYLAAAAFDALIRSIMGARALLPILATLSGRFPLIARGISMVAASATLSLGALGLVIAAVGLAALAMSKIGENNGFKRATDQVKQLEDAMNQTRDAAKNLKGELSGEIDRKYMAKSAYETAQARLKNAAPGTQEYADALRDVNTAYAELESATGGVTQKTKELTDLYGNKGRLGNAMDQIRAQAQALRAGFRMDSMPFLKGSSIEGLGKQLENITGTEPIEKLRELSAAALQVSKDSKWGDVVQAEFFQQSVGIDKLIRQYGQLKNARADAAAVPILAQRSEKGLGIDSAEMQRSLGQLAQQNSGLALTIGLRVRDQGDAARMADAALQALQNKVSAKDIIATINANPDNAQATIEALIALVRRPETKPVTVSADKGNYDWLVSEVTRTLTAPLQIVGVRAEGGPVAAASGYSTDSASMSASRRPKRRAMGAFREPTFLVGEENRTEYVIATNPAYRAQNKVYLAAAARELGMAVVEPAAGGRTPWAKRKVLLNAIFNPSLNDDKRKAFSKNVRTSAANIKGIEDEASALQKMMDNDEMRNRPNAWRSHRDKRGKMLKQLLGIYRAAYPAAGRNNKRALRGMIAGVEGDILQLRADKFDGAISKSAEEMKQAQLDRTTRENATLRASLLTAQAFNTVSGGLLAESFSGGPLASGGPRMSSKGGGVNVVINTLHPGSPDVYDAIGKAATAGQSLQGAVQAPRIAVPV